MLSVKHLLVGRDVGYFKNCSLQKGYIFYGVNSRSPGEPMLYNFWKIGKGLTEVIHLKDSFSKKLQSKLVYRIMSYCGVDEAMILTRKSTERRFAGRSEATIA